jgi:DNA sulfur modification protein DndD
MILKRLTLEDFGLFGGIQSLELAPEPDRPVILVGGANGAGKTTILEAIRLGLHGKRALGPRVSRSDYDVYLSTRLHVADGGLVAEAASVTLDFEHAHSGVAHEYSVTRRFTPLKSSVKEELTITRDGELVTDVGESARQDFLDGLMPPGVAGLFLFDGEKIQSLADDDNGAELADAIRRLLGVDVIDQLNQDLRRLAFVAAPGEGKESDELRAAAAALQDVECRLVALADREATLNTRRDRRLAQVARTEERLAQQGGALAVERDRHATDARESEAQIAACRAELGQLVAGVLPFALAPELAQQVIARLEQEQGSEEARAVACRLEAVADDLNSRLKVTGRQSVVAVLTQILVGDADLGEPLNRVSPAQRELMRRQLEAAREELPKTATALRRRLVRAQERVESARGRLAQIPDDAAVAPIVSELQQLERELGGLDVELSGIDESRRQLNHEKLHRQRVLERAEAALARSSRAAAATSLALKTTALLDELARRVEQRRLEEIERLTTWYFNRLSHKGELLSRVNIDPETFIVSVRRWDETELPKQRLSAGEKQLFAIAVLWALAEVSGRELPVVVDTPLARLDHDHRARLLEQYFPEVSHQVVVLSTDTEVDVAAAAALAEKTARQIFLSHDTSKGATQITDGYFHVREVVGGR